MADETTKTSDCVSMNGWPIWYDKYGTGPNVLLLIPGAIGTAESDFKEQLRGPNAFDLNKYTIIAIELAGYGRSRPPKRPYGPKVYEFDADCALKIMETLGYKSYSVIGWSEGSKGACVMAIKRPAIITSLTLIGFTIFASKKTLDAVIATRVIEKLPYYENLLPIYGDSVHSIWNEFVIFCTQCPVIFSDGVWTKDLYKIRCPVLLIQGKKDPIGHDDHQLRAKQQIPDCRLKQFANGSHNVHQTHAAEVKTIVEEFFEDCEGF